MRFLFVHQNFPGQFLHLVRHLVAQQRHEVVFLTEANRNEIPGVRKIPYRKPPTVPPSTHWIAQDFEAATRRAEIVAGAAGQLKDLGFQPDIIIGHHGWGELLNLSDVWPDVPLLGYFEFFYQTQGADIGFDPEFLTPASDYPRVRAKNGTNLLALALGQHGHTPTQWQLSTYPEWARPQITVLPEGVDLSICKPDPAVRSAELKIPGATIAPHHKLVTYVARDLEPYRGFHVFMRALPEILTHRKDVRIVLVGGDGVSYGSKPKDGSWKQQLLAELGNRIDPDRVIFPGRVDYDTHIRLLQRADAHVYLSYPFVASWSLREAIGCGAPIVGADIAMIREFISHNRNGLLTPFHVPKAIAAAVLELLEDTRLAHRLGQNGRRLAERTLDLNAYLATYGGLIDRITNGKLRQPALKRGPRTQIL